MSDSPVSSSSEANSIGHGAAKAITSSVYEMDGAMQHNPGFDEMRDHHHGEEEEGGLRSPGQETTSSSGFSQNMDMDINTVGVFDPKQSKLSVRKISGASDMPDHVTDFSSLSKPAKIAALCVEKVPAWKGRVHPADVEINQLCEGLSNQLFRVSLPNPRATSSASDSPTDQEEPVAFTRVLFRIYGKDAKSFYDPVYELKVFKTLSRYRIAPQLIAYGDGWRIEEWHASIAVPTKLLGNPSIFCQIASQLGRFHKLDQRQDFPRSFSTEPATIKRLRSWAAEAEKVSFKEPEQRRKLERLHVDRMVEEAGWLIDYLTQNQEDIVKGQGMDIVFSHNDVQENNILQTQYGLRLIDFEYAHYNYQAYDIANLFCEFTMDYTEKHYPFFATDLAAYPDEQKQRMFLSVYLSEYLETPIFPDNDLYILPLMKNVSKFALASHLLWGLWSVIRAPQAPTYDDFDFLVYAKFRFDSYFRMKNIILSEDKEATEKHDAELLRKQLQLELQEQRNSNSGNIHPKDVRRYIGFFRGIEIGAVALSIGLSLGTVFGILNYRNGQPPLKPQAPPAVHAPAPAGGVTAPWNRVHAPGTESSGAVGSGHTGGYTSSGVESPWGASGGVPSGMSRVHASGGGQDHYHQQQQQPQSIHSPFGSATTGSPFTQSDQQSAAKHYQPQQQQQEHHSNAQGRMEQQQHQTSRQQQQSGGGFADQLVGAAFNAAAKTAFGGSGQGGQGSGSGNDEMMGAVMSQVGQNLYQQAEQSGWTKFVPWGFDSLRPYFNITHSYVKWKCLFLMIPFVKRLFQPGKSQRHYSVDNEMDNLQAPTQRTGDPNEGVALRFVPDRRPDMYIPLMSFITYVLAYAIIKGAADDGSFHPDVLYDTATFAAVLSVIELVLARGAGYFANMTSLRLLDLVCVIGYKYFHLSVYCITRILFSSKITTPYFWWGLLGYLSLAAAYACLVSLQYFTTYKTAMQAHLEVSGTHTSVLVKYVVFAIALAQSSVDFTVPRLIACPVMATEDFIRIQEECSRMVLREQMGGRRPIAGEYTCHSCTGMSQEAMNKLIAALPYRRASRSHRRAVSDPGTGGRGQQLCATQAWSGPVSQGAATGRCGDDDGSSSSGLSTGQLGYITGLEEPRNGWPSSSRSVSECHSEWRFTYGPVSYITAGDSSECSSNGGCPVVGRDAGRLEAADRLHLKVHRMGQEPSEVEDISSVDSERAANVSLTPLVSPRLPDEEGSCGKVGMRAEICVKYRGVPSASLARAGRRAKTASDQKPTSRAKKLVGNDLRAVRGTGLDKRERTAAVAKAAPCEVLKPAMKAAPCEVLKPAVKAAPCEVLKPAVTEVMRPVGPRKMAPVNGSMSDTEVVVKTVARHYLQRRSASVTPRVALREPKRVRKKVRSSVGKVEERSAALPPRRGGSGYSEARRKVLQRTRERYLLKQAAFKLWVEVKRDLRARKDTERATRGITGQVPVTKPRDVCHTRTSLLRNSAKLLVSSTEERSPLPSPAVRRPPASVKLPKACRFCDEPRSVSDVRARYAEWVSREAEARVMPWRAGMNFSLDGYLKEYTVKADHGSSS
ncbi:hypothetical protein FOL47_003995 [Perkinsus chesapeaki]|uniref:Choline/ethanolamine kinase n=1 Tax=Perkinsus chesapeaki TaxID=330153 RepID=A0A7J6MZE0_PERCH|nr:hypothetical protein FOL47_003995 [Perkinsus chesapeaki]